MNRITRIAIVVASAALLLQAGCLPAAETAFQPAGIRLLPSIPGLFSDLFAGFGF